MLGMRTRADVPVRAASRSSSTAASTAAGMSSWMYWPEPGTLSVPKFGNLVLSSSRSPEVTSAGCGTVPISSRTGTTHRCSRSASDPDSSLDFDIRWKASIDPLRSATCPAV